MSEQTIGTTCVQGGYHPGDAEPRQVPIYQSTTWKYDTSEHMGKLFDLEESGYFYSRLQNPTCDLVAAKIDLRQLLHHVYYLGLSDVAAGLSGNIDGIQPEADGLYCLDSILCRYSWRPLRRDAL